MSFGAFDILLHVLTTLLRSECMNQVSPQLQIKIILVCKIIDLPMVVV